MPLRRTDRDAPYHFAGRGEELGELGDRLAVVAKTGDASGGLALITGVPGSGKTSLARAFAESSGVPNLRGGVSDLDDPLDLFLSIGTAIGRESHFEKIAAVAPRLTNGGVGVASATASTPQEHVRPDRGFASMLRTSKAKWPRPLVIVVDELQNLNARQAETLRVLHEGVHGCPILVVGAGLENTPAELSSHGISRVTKGLRLGPLHRDATCEVISKSLADFEREAPPYVVDSLAAASHDFPQHIHCYLSAALDAVDHSVGWHAPDMVDRVLEKGDKLRAEYYDDRLTAMGRGRSRMVPVIARMAKESVRSLDVQDAIDAAGADGERAVADAIQHGVLTLERDESVSFGIPSFHRHMMEVLRQRTPPGTTGS